MKVYRDITGFKAASSFFTWLYRVTVNLCLDKTRKRQRRKKYQAVAVPDTGEKRTGQEGLERADESLDQKMWQRELQRALQVALNRMKPQLRSVIVLKDMEGLSYAEVAQVFV